MGYSIVSKKRQAAAAKAKPWLTTRGAITEAGRRASSSNRTIDGIHSREFLTIKRALNEAEALLAEGILPQETQEPAVEPARDSKGSEPYFAEEQEPYFAEETPAFYANPNSKTQPTLSSGSE